jgi:hypothetical protein
VNDGLKQLLRRYLAEQKMFNIIELLDTGAEDKAVIELFEKNVLYQSPLYQNMLLHMNMRENMSQEQWDMMVDSCFIQQLHQNPINFQIYQILPISNQEFDCGCN